MSRAALAGFIVGSFRFQLSDGRRIGVSLVGEPTATRLVVMCLPTPGAGSFDPVPAVTSRHPVRLMYVDRPGYGGSDGLPKEIEPTIERFADDIAEYLRHVIDTARGVTGLELGPVAVVGWSFGGPVAIALAARHPELVDSLVIVGAPRPKRLRHGERYSPVTELRRKGVERSRGSLTASLEEEGLPTLEALGVDIDDADAHGLGTAGRLQHMIDAAWLQGAAGVASDRSAVANETWLGGFDQLKSPALLLYASDDPVAGLSDAKWYARHLPNGTVTETCSAGRLAIISEWGRILQWVEAPAPLVSPKRKGRLRSRDPTGGLAIRTGGRSR
jgi:pimeloyl-ACP methyl ester carboxylesterase